MSPDPFQLLGKLTEVLQRCCRTRIYGGTLLLEAYFDLAHLLQSLVPAAFQLCSHEAVLGVRGVVLPLRTLSGITGSFQIAA
jgi:hypothetical protein